MVSLIDSLEGLGMVERRVDPADRRAYQVQITPAGQEAGTAAAQAIATAEAALFAPLGGKDWRRLHGLLRRLSGLDPEFTGMGMDTEVEGTAVPIAVDGGQQPDTPQDAGTKGRKGGKRGKKR
jgi:hypothetical protein